MAINHFEAPTSSLQAISGALQVASQIYGMKHAGIANDLVQQQIQLEKAKLVGETQKTEQSKLASDIANDPSSAAAKAGALAQAAAIGAYEKKGIVDHETASALKMALLGSAAIPAQGDVNHQNEVPYAPYKAEVPGKPGMSLAQQKLVLPEEGGLSAIMKGQQAADAKVAGFNFRDTQMQERQDFQAHQRVLAKLKGDPQVAKRLGQYQNLNNALSNFQNADIANPQAIDELQQAIRSNLGIGAGGVGERQHTYINSLGLNADRIQQFVTGDPVAISKDNALAHHLKQLVSLESQNIAGQMDKRLNALTSGNKSMYDRRPDYKSDLLDAVSAYKDQYSQASDSGAGAGSHSPGLVSEANAGSNFTPDVMGYAKQHGISNEAALAIKMKRTGGK